MKNCIYRFLNKNNEIIYIGKAKDLKNRINNHNHLPKECYNERMKIEYVSFDTIDEADIAERYLISKTKPKYNTDFKSKDIAITINIFENLQWIDFNSKHDIITDLKIKRKIIKIDLDIQKKDIEAKSIRDKIKIIDLSMEEILNTIGRGRPCAVHTDNKIYHVYTDDKLFYSTEERNSEGLDEYAKLYEKWYNEFNKEGALLKEIDYLKNKKIDLLLKANNKTCNKDIKSLYVKFDSIDDEFILNNAIESMEARYKKALSHYIINYGHYKYGEFIQNIDHEFSYNKYYYKNDWVILIDNIESSDIRTKYADSVIKNVENYLESIFGVFKLDTIIEEGKGSLWSNRTMPIAYLIKKPIND